MSDLIRSYHETGDRRFLRDFYCDPGYVRLYDAPKPKWTAKYEMLAALMDLAPGDRVLDVGAARGHLRSHVEQFGATYKAADISPGFQPDFVCDAETLEGVPDGFDWVVISDVLEHLPDPEAALRAATRVGARVLTVVPNWYHLDRIQWLPRDAGDRHISRMPPRRWLRLHRRAGWTIESYRGFYYVPSIAFYPWYPLRLFDSVMRRSPLHTLSKHIDKHLAHLPGVRVAAQELVTVGLLRDLG